MQPAGESSGETRQAAVTMAATTVLYGAVGAWYFWADWFRFFHFGQPLVVEPAGLAIPLTRCAATLLSPWRLALVGLTVLLLGLSALRLHRGSRSARALALLTLWGLMLPQLFWLTELSLDWFGGRALATIVAACIFAVAAPTALLWRDGETLDGWGALGAQRWRLLVAAVALGWMAFGATVFLDHSYQFRTVAGFGWALAVLPLAGLAMVGLYRQRAWALPAALAAAGAMAGMAVTLGGAEYLPDLRAMDSFHALVAGNTPNSLVAAVVPAACLAALLEPFLAALGRRCLEPARASRTGG